MFFDKFRDKYSFNFLAICGWIVFVAYFTFYLLATLYQWYGSAISFIVLTILIFAAFCLSLSIIILILEEIFTWKIKNQKFLNNKFIFIFQILGSIFAILPTLYFLFIFFS